MEVNGQLHPPPPRKSPEYPLGRSQNRSGCGGELEQLRFFLCVSYYALYMF